jgi:hypothetical protein
VGQVAGRGHRSRRRLGFGIALGAALIAAGLATPTIVRAFSSSDPGINVHRLSATQKVGDRLVMKPVPAGVQPMIDAAAAVAAMGGQEGRLGKLGSVDATLALITDEQYGHINADGSVTPYYKDLLAWVIVAPRTMQLMPDFGPDPAPGSPPRDVSPRTCAEPAYFVVDATSGAALFAIQDC